MPTSVAYAFLAAALAPLVGAVHNKNVVQNAGRSDFMMTAKAREQSLEEAWTAELDAESQEKPSPVKRVILLLQEMRAELLKEGNKESEMYDQMVCWCETNEKEKTKDIAVAEGRIADLMAEMEARSATKGKLGTNIAALKTLIGDETAALKTAVAIREKAAAAFSAEENDMMQAITNLKNAIIVLSKHQTSSSLLQLDSPELASVRAVMEDASMKYDLMLGDDMRVGRLGAPKHKSATALLAIGSKQGMDKAWASVLDVQGELVPLDIAQRMLAVAAKDAKASSAFVQGPASYAPQSSQIFGILKQMKAEFEENLSQAQKDEMKAVSEFEELSKSKASQIAASKAKLDSLEQQYADNQKALADAEQDYELSTGKRASDVEFLRNLRLTCQDLDRQWRERSKTRNEEIKAVGEALVILTDDDNREHLESTVSFLQHQSVSVASQQAMRSNAISALQNAMHQPAFKTDDLLVAWNGRSVSAPTSKLAALAVSVQLDSFKKVKEMMDNMIADLKTQQSEEVKFKAECDSEFSTNAKVTFTKKEAKADIEANIEGLSKLITTLSDEIAAAKTSLSDSEIAIKKASETREKENAEFQTTIGDQRATQAILDKALHKLKAFYGKKTSLLSLARRTTKQEPPVKFTKYKSNAGSSPVMGLLSQIIKESKALEKEAIAAEIEAQVSYESFVKETSAVIAELSKAITQKSEAIASSKVSLEQAESDLQSTTDEISSLQQYKADLHQQCDFVVKNFNIRQQARLQEIESIQKAKSFLDGMNDDD